MFKRLSKMNQLAKEAGTLKADYPGAWAVGEEIAADLLADRSPDLVRMIHENGQDGVNFYVQQATEGVVSGVASGEIEIPEPLSKDSLKAGGVSCGMAMHDALDREAR